MKIPGFGRHALTSFAAAAVLAGCGGSQPPIGAPGAMPQSRASSGYGYNTLHSFGKPHDGQQPKAGLIDLDGTLYGTTYQGGKYGAGTVFSISTTGSESVLYSFGTPGKDNDGANPSASLVAVKGVLYGTTEYGGGEDGFGTVFKLSMTGVEKVLHSFQGYQGHSNYDGAQPVASLINVNGTLFSTTSNGGDSVCFGDGCGTVYSISRNGSEKALHNFELYYDGAIPLGSLVDLNGTLYGTTEIGGSQSSPGSGTVFSVSKTGTENVIHTFGGVNGAYPVAGLINVNGTLYGTTTVDGAYGTFGNYGTAFSITASGSLTTLHSFGSGSDGGGPAAPLLDRKGTLYGTTEAGGAYGKGTVFRMSLTGSNEKVLHSFGRGADGATPLAGLINVKGTLYGTTSAGGAHGDGTVFALKLGSK